MMKQTLTIFVIFSSFFISLSSSHGQEPSPNVKVPTSSFKELREGKSDKVIKIIDPFVIQLQRHGLVRLTGIDVPDYSPHEQGAIAESAVKILKDLLIDQNVKVYQTKDRNKGRSNRMGHKLMHVALDKDNGWVQGFLVRLGLARVRSDKSNTESIRDLYKIEKIARAEKLGLWAFEEYSVLKDTDAGKYMNSYQVVEGTVRSAVRKQNSIFLNFGNDWRKDFTIGIKPSEIRKFSQQGMNPLDLNGKRIRARGWIRDYNGAFMEIDHSERIEILN